LLGLLWWPEELAELAGEQLGLLGRGEMPPRGISEGLSSESSKVLLRTSSLDGGCDDLRALAKQRGCGPHQTGSASGP
jgi:hypothetical protein